MSESIVKGARESILERAMRAGRAEAPVAAPATLVERAVAKPAPAEPGFAAAPLLEPREGPKVSRQSELDLAALSELGFIVPGAPPTATAEEFRLVKRQLLLRALRRGPGAIPRGNLILVCSARPGEGKTFCAINLALSIASEQDLTVLLVDADFHKPEILSTLGLEGQRGLIDVIADPSVDLADCLIRTDIEHLSVLPAGRQHNLTTELLASERMERMVEEIAERYSDRIIIFDSPPALASSVASTLAMHVGQVVFVVEAESTRESDLREALDMFAGCERLQLLLNRARFSPGTRRFGDYYGYGV